MSRCASRKAALIAAASDWQMPLRVCNSSKEACARSVSPRATRPQRLGPRLARQMRQQLQIVGVLQGFHPTSFKSGTDPTAV
jgi:hypothetical protein